MDLSPALKESCVLYSCRVDRTVRQALAEYLTEFAWEYYATATFHLPVDVEFAKKAVEGWIAGLEGAYAYAVIESGFGGERTHCHLLIGGRHITTDLWPHGALQLSRYDPERGACWYVTKATTDGDLIGTPLRRTQQARNRLYAPSVVT